MAEVVENATETLTTVPVTAVGRQGRGAYLVHIYPTGPGMGTRYLLGDEPLIIGRDAACDIRLEDPSVSRRHARIQPGTDGSYVIDLQSTNGTFVNDVPASMCKLKDGDQLRVGNWILRYLAGGNVEADYHEEIYRLTIIDGLTGIHNKRALADFLDRELSRSVRHGRPLALVLFDIDRFKAINDRLGHLGGDCAIRDVVQRVKAAIRKEELFARYGGEEFAIVLPETNREGALVMAERLRKLVAATPFEYQGQSYPVTVSIGIAATEGEEGLTVEELTRRADAKLYEAKGAGRNCVRA